MNFQQLRAVRETARQGYNLTTVAQVLHTSQPGVSRQIRELEDELGLGLFVRAGKRLTGLTPSGARMLPIVERMLEHAERLRRSGIDYAREASGQLVIASPHPVLSRRSYYLVQPDLPERPALTLFKAWLLGHVEN